jgi:pSer/pThr/pTyr-binding forkhead associated (FHA) protein
LALTLSLCTNDGAYAFTVAEGAVYVIGRRHTNDVVLEHATVGASHCSIDFTRSVPTIEDLGSPSGVWVNQRHIGASQVELVASDRVRIGTLVFTVRHSLQGPVDRFG